MGALLLPAIIVGVGGLLTFIGFTAYRIMSEKTALAAEAVPVRAEVVTTRFQLGTGERQSKWYATVRFRTQDGREVQGERLITEAQFNEVEAGASELPFVYAASDPDRSAGAGVWQRDASEKRLFVWVMLPWGILTILGGIYLGYRWIR